MKADRARRIRDWIILNKMDIEGEDFTLDDWKKRDAEYLEYVKERVPSPVGDIFFDSNEYVWTTNPFLLSLQATQREYLVDYYKRHNKKLYWLSFVPSVLVVGALSLPILLVVYLTVCTVLPALLNTVICMALFALLWFGVKQVTRRSEAVIFRAEEKAQENEDFETRWEHAKHAYVELRQAQQWADSRYDVKFHVGFGPYGRSINGPYEEGAVVYDWKHIKENRFIIVDKATGLEAPLLPGVSPYIKESLFS